MYCNYGIKTKGIRSSAFYKAGFISALLIVIAPILDIYAFFTVSVSCGDIAIILAVLLTLFQGDIRRWDIKKNYLFLLLYFISSSALQIREYTLIKQWISFAYFIVALGLIETSYNSSKYLIRLYQSVAIFEAILIILQRVFYMLFRINIPGLIPGMLTTYGASTSDYMVTISGIRCTGNFTEPAMAARYLAFPLLFAIFEVVRSKRIVSAKMIIYVLALICTFSGNAFIVLAITWVYYISQQITMKRKNRFIKCAGVIILMLVMLFALTKMVDLEYLWNRRAEFTGKGITGKSAYIRVTRGYEGFFACSFMQKIFGVGIGNYAYLAEHELYKKMTLVTDSLMDYMNGIQFYLIQGGIIGFMLFLSQFMPILKSAAKENKWLCIVMLAMMSFSSIAVSSLFLLCYLCIYKYGLCRNAEYDVITAKNRKVES